MSTSRHRRFDPQVEVEAAHWASRFECGDVTSAELKAFSGWLDHDPAHRSCFAQYQEFSNQLNDVLPTLAHAGSQAALIKAAPHRKRVAWAIPVSLVAATLAIVALIFQPVRHRPVLPATERQTLELADGTRADLNENTDVVVALSETHRRVTMTRGEAMFSVAKDPNRPFVVETPAGLVRVTGTRFNVRTGAGGRLDVTVLEGSVEVEPRAALPRTEPGAPVAAPLTLTPGQQISIANQATQITELEPALLGDVVAWRDGGVLFEGVPLADVLARFARYHRRLIVVSADAGALRLGGRFSLDDLDGLLRGLEGALPVRVTHEVGGEIRVTGR